jgi:hypothetical protein
MEEEEKDEDVGSDHSLSSIPQSPTERVNQLRELDEDATNSLEANRSYQEELKLVMARLQAASKRTNELKVRILRFPPHAQFLRERTN